MRTLASNVIKIDTGSGEASKEMATLLLRAKTLQRAKTTTINPDT